MKPGLRETVRKVCDSLRDKEMIRRLKAQHCQCRSGSPDTCPKCTDMESGEKYTDQDVAD